MRQRPSFPTLLLGLSAAIGVATAVSAQTTQPRIQQNAAGGVTSVEVAGPGSWQEISATLRARLADKTRTNLPPLSREARDAMPGPLLMEYGWRRFNAGAEDGRFLLTLGRMRVRWEALQCRDSSVGQVPQMVQMAFPASDPAAFAAEAKQTAQQAATLEALLAEGAIFNGQASPWWACSQGILAIMAGQSGRTLSESEWRVPAARSAVLRSQAEAQLRDAAAKLRATPPAS